METLTPEQFKQKYGKVAVDSFATMNAQRGKGKQSSFSKSSGSAVNKVNDTLGLGGATNVFGRMANTLIADYPNSPLSKIVGQTQAEKDVEGLTGATRSEVIKQGVLAPSGKEMLGATAQVGSVAAGTLLGGPATLAGKAAVGAGLGYAYDVGQDLIDNKSAVDTFTPGVATMVGAAVPFAAPVLGALKSTASKATQAVGEAVTSTIPDSTLIQGAKQTATDLVERVPRFVGRVQDDLAEQAVKAEQLKTATPQVAQAIKSELPQVFIDKVPKANPVTKQAFKQVLDIAEAPKTKFGQKANPAIVGGELASKQYDVIDKQRQTIGKMIGDEIEKLGKSNVKANMGVAFKQVDDVLAQNGIKVGPDGALSSLKYTDKEMAVIQDLFSKSRKGGDVLSAIEVRDMDNLFSKMQREARIDGISDLRVKANGEDMSLFRVFRDIYSNQLENIAPEIRPLNAQYRNLVTLTDDIEDSILKTPDFNITKTADPAEFAKVNLRRIFGEAQSSPVYEAIADEMDTISRQLGYADASPKEVAAFAQEVRKLYPETVPTAGQQGIITNAFDAVTRVLGAGKADVTDQQKALRALLEATGNE